MKTRLWVAVFFGKTKVNDVDLVAFLTSVHQKVIWFNVAVYKVVGMEEFQSLYLGTEHHVCHGEKRPATDIAEQADVPSDQQA
jgi:hypothetical protein